MSCWPSRPESTLCTKHVCTRRRCAHGNDVHTATMCTWQIARAVQPHGCRADPAPAPECAHMHTVCVHVMSAHARAYVYMHALLLVSHPVVFCLFSLARLAHKTAAMPYQTPHTSRVPHAGPLLPPTTVAVWQTKLIQYALPNCPYVTSISNWPTTT